MPHHENVLKTINSELSHFRNSRWIDLTFKSWMNFFNKLIYRSSSFEEIFGKMPFLKKVSKLCVRYFWLIIKIILDHFVFFSYLCTKCSLCPSYEISFPSRLNEQEKRKKITGNTGPILLIDPIDSNLFSFGTSI